MKRRLTILVLFAIAIWALSALQLSSLTLVGGLPLATTALALLVSALSGELFAPLGIPRLTGFLLAGLVLGPVTGLLGGALLWDLLPLQHAALGLLAFGAGAQLDLRTSKGVLKQSSSIAIASTLIMLAATSLIILSLKSVLASWAPKMALSAAALAAMALLSSGTSPLILGVLASRKQSPNALAALGLSSALIKSACVLFGVGALLALSGDQYGEAASLTLASIASALTLAMVLRTLRPHLQSQSTFVLGALLICAPSALELIGAEPILTLALTGALTRHWGGAEAGEALKAQAHTFMAPGALVLFTLLGATLSPPSMALILVALVLFLMRFGSMWLGTWVATRWSHAPHSVREN